MRSNLLHLGRVMASKKARQLLALAALTPALFSLSCASPGAPVDPEKQTYRQVRRAVQSGIEEGIQHTENLDALIVPARQNICDCAAPDTEIYTHGRWHRVYLEGDEDALDTFFARAQAAQNRHHLSKYKLRGALSSATKTSARGLEYPIFKVTEFLD